MNTKNSIPWIVAASAMLFAMIVLVRNEVIPSREEAQFARPDVRPVIQSAQPDWRSSQRPASNTPPSGDFSPWTAGEFTDNTPQLQPSPARTPTPKPSPSPTPSPTPKPEFELRGVVLNQDGDPVPDALVRIVTGRPNHAAERSAVTNVAGSFSITGIPEAKIDRVVVEAQGYSVTLLEQLPPLPLPDELQIGLSPLAGIDAVVLDFSTTDSEPVLFSGEMQASLMQLKAAGDVSTNSLGISEPVLPVDSYLPVRNQDVVVVEGELRFDNVEPGRYRVSVKSGIKVAESDPLTVAEASRTSTTLILGMKHTVEGNVVGGDTKAPVAQARVTLSPASDPGAAPEFPEYMSFTDGDGEFVIPEVQPGRYWMVVGAAGYTTRTLENFRVMPGAPPENTSVTLSKQEPLITVSVTNADGRPVPKAPLVLMTTGAPSPKTYFGNTDDAGLYRFDKLVSGRYTLSITDPTDRARQKTVNIELGDGEVRELSVRFGKQVPVTGKVTVGGEQYQGMLSFALRGSAMADNLVTTDDKGGFTTKLEPGEYLVGTPENPAGTLVNISNTEAQSIKVELP